MEEIIIRQAIIGDIETINSIYNEAISLGYATADTVPITLEAQKNWFKAHREEGNPILVAENRGSVIGYNALSYYRSGRKALIHVRETSYYIQKDSQGKGVASQLMKQIIKLCLDLQITDIITFIINGNISSIKLMEKFSFQLWGRLPEVVSGTINSRDHLIFGKKLKN